MRVLMIALAAAAAAFLGLRLLHPLGVYEAQTVDFRFRWRGPRQPDPRLVIVAIDEPTLASFKQQQGRVDEWPRARHGQLLDRLTGAGAAAVGWDVTFSDRSRLPGDDEKLAAAVRRSHHTILPMYQSVSALAGSEGDRTAVFNAVDMEAQSWLSSHGLQLEAEIENPYQAYGWVLPIPLLRDAGADIGYIDTPPDPDNVYRHIQPLRADNLGRWRMHLAAAVFNHFARGTCGTPSSKSTMDALLNQPQGTPFIDYAGPPGVIPRLSYVDVLQGQFKPEQIRSKIVLVGRTGVSEDVRPNPFSTTANGIEITANTINSLLRGRFLRRASWWIEILAALLLALAASWVMTSLKTWPALASVLGLAIVYTGLSQWLFAGPGIVMPMVGPLLAQGMAAAAALHYRLAEEEAARQRIQARWQSFVGPDVLEALLHNPELDEGHGIKADVTVVFSDIRGYSTLSEYLAPEEVIQHLNEHFQEMTHFIFEHGGTVLGVTGDGLLIVFGWPRPYADHADRAVMAVRKIVARLEEINERLKLEGRPVLESGFGVHSGMVVAGRVGGDQGSQLTVIGDTVNVAARVQDLNKTLQSQMLVTGSTYDQLKIKVETGKMARVPVKGRQEPVAVYEVRHRKGEGQAEAD